MTAFCGLNGRVALVTGGAGGIGRAVVEELARAGAFVFIHHRADDLKVAELVDALAARGETVAAIKADLTGAAQVDCMFQRVQAAGRGLDILVNNAGVMRVGMMSMVPDAAVEEMLDVNLLACYRVTRVASRFMIRKRFGRIVNIGSIIGEVGAAGHVAYAASKGGVSAMTVAAAKELGPFGITVNAVAPGIIETKLIDHVDAKQRHDITKSIALRRLGQPQDVAPLVRFLCSESAAYITGQVIGVDGAYVL